MLRHVDEAAYLRLLHRSLRPGGLLMLLTGNADEPEAGPSVLTERVGGGAGRGSRVYFRVCGCVVGMTGRWPTIRSSTSLTVTIGI